jgi:hypothetical protein
MRRDRQGLECLTLLAMLEAFSTLLARFKSGDLYVHDATDVVPYRHRWRKACLLQSHAPCISEESYHT